MINFTIILFSVYESQSCQHQNESDSGCSAVSLEPLSLSLQLPIKPAEWDVIVNIEMEKNIKVIIATSHVPSLEISTAIANAESNKMTSQSRYEFMREDKLRHHI